MIRLPTLFAATTWLLLASPAIAQEAPAAAEPVAAGQAMPEGAPIGMDSILGADLMRHAKWLASDALGGRLTGTPEQHRTAKYIAEHFQSLGLKPLGDPAEGEEARGFLQQYPVTIRSLNEEQSGLRIDDLAINRNYAVIAPEEFEAIDVTGAPLFAAIGGSKGGTIEDLPEDLSDVIPLVAVRTRAKPKSIEQVFGIGFTLMTRLKRLGDRLRGRGAKLVVFCVLDDDSGVPDLLNYVGMSPGKPLVTPRDGLERITDHNEMAMMAQMMGGQIPFVFASAKLSRQLLTAAGMKVADLARDAKPAEVTSTVRVALRTNTDSEAFASNVAAYIEGSDPQLKAEAVVFSAHMDHVGRRFDGEIFNGADDNGSGTSGLLEIAEAFATAKTQPKRSIVFLSVSGEELGLWGSAWYAEHPTWPKERIAADVNIDMIGRSGRLDGRRRDATGRDEVMITPSYRHRMFSSIVRDGAKFAQSLGMELKNGDTYYARSDHYNFARKGIPVVFFCTGDHPDYHRASDHAENLDPAKMQRVTRLAYWTGRAVADADQRPTKLGRQKDWLEER